MLSLLYLAGFSNSSMEDKCLDEKKNGSLRLLAIVVVVIFVTVGFCVVRTARTEQMKTNETPIKRR